MLGPFAFTQHPSPYGRRLPTTGKLVTMETEGLRFPIHFILMCFRSRAVYPLRYWCLEEVMQESGFEIDHSSIDR